MQLTNTPAKLVLPFANAGAKNTIPTASQIGITAGAASLVDGFPPLTRTPIAAGGVPPSGLDMNGILFELSAILRWTNAGGGYAFDSAFATDSNVGGYPKGARVMRSDGLGYWFNTVENNTTDPESAGVGVAAAAGWVPDFANGVTTVAMASANVTLTPVQYGKPVIVITGTLTANLNLIFPNIVNEWTVINNTTGAFTITCKTAAGTGVVVNTAALIVGDGTNIQSAITDAAAIFGETVSTATGGTADAITATFAPVPRYPSNGVCLSVRAASANATTTPTFTPNSGVIAAATIVKGNNLPLVAGDIAGAGHWLELAWDSTLTKWVLLNPATGVTSQTSASIVGNFRNLIIYNDVTTPNSKLNVFVDELVLKDASGNSKLVSSVSLVPDITISGANGLDTGAEASNTWYSVWVINNGTTTASLLSTSAAAPTMPSGYTFKARVGWVRNAASSNFLKFKQVNRRVQHSVPQVMASGAAGNISTPTWVAVAVGAFVPSTAGIIYVGMQRNGASGQIMVASNNGYGAINSNGSPQPPINDNDTSEGTSRQFQGAFVLESTNLYWASAGASNYLMCQGWDDV